VFESVVVVVFQSDFRLEMYQNNIFFLFLKFIFDISTSKRFENIKKYFKLFLNFGQPPVGLQSQMSIKTGH